MLRLAALAFLLAAPPALAGPLPDAIEGWKIEGTDAGWQDLAAGLDAAIESSPLNKVTEASATVGAEQIGEEIAGNKVVGVFAAPYAVRMLDASVAAGIEAPLRFYVVEREGGGSALAWKTAGFAFAPYDDGGEKLDALADELDGIMADIAADALSR